MLPFLAEKWLCSLQESLVKLWHFLLCRHLEDWRIVIFPDTVLASWTPALLSFCQWSQLARSKQRGFLNRAGLFSIRETPGIPPTPRHLQPPVLGMVHPDPVQDDTSSQQRWKPGTQIPQTGTGQMWFYSVFSQVIKTNISWCRVTKKKQGLWSSHCHGLQLSPLAVPRPVPPSPAHQSQQPQPKAALLPSPKWKGVEEM